MEILKVIWGFDGLTCLVLTEDRFGDREFRMRVCKDQSHEEVFTTALRGELVTAGVLQEAIENMKGFIEFITNNNN